MRKQSRREFLHSDDFADAIVTVLEKYSSPEPINIGTGEDVTIAEVARLVRETIGLGAQLRFDTSRPDGMPRKLLDVSRIRALGWSPKIGLEQGLEQTYRWFREQSPVSPAQRLIRALS